jgi:hypothetical protein
MIILESEDYDRLRATLDAEPDPETVAKLRAFFAACDSVFGKQQPIDPTKAPVVFMRRQP